MAKETGRIIQRNNIWYLIINKKTDDGKYKPQWISTGLKGDDNKTQAEAVLRQHMEDEEQKKSITESKETSSPAKQKIVFADFLYIWLDRRKDGIIGESPLSPTSYGDYKGRIDNIMYPYWKSKGTLIEDLTEYDIEEYYDMLRNKRHNSANTIDKHHATIRSTLSYAYKKSIVQQNVASKVERAKVVHSPVDYYNTNQIEKLFKVVKNTEFEIFVVFGAMLGMRRGEILGLKWETIDFDNNTFMINHTVVNTKKNGHDAVVRKDSCKNIKSTRAMPLPKKAKEVLLQMREDQEKNRQVCGSSYYTGDSTYVCVDKMGHLIKPAYVTQHFSILLQQNGLPHIKFHALRHSCASMLLSKNVSLKVVQEYLGHSDYSTTDKYYGHLTMREKTFASHALDSLNFL